MDIRKMKLSLTSPFVGKVSVRISSLTSEEICQESFRLGPSLPPHACCGVRVLISIWIDIGENVPIK